jgi:hypothetical protein
VQAFRGRGDRWRSYVANAVEESIRCDPISASLASITAGIAGPSLPFGFGFAEYFAGRLHFRECAAIFAIEEVGIVALARALAKRRLLVKCII